MHSVSIVALLILVLSNSEIIKLNKDNFFQETLLSGRKGNWFIRFYAPWCAYSKKFLPMWIELGNTFNDTVNFADVDAMENTELAQKFGLTNYPSLVYIVDNKFVKYDGPQHVDAIKEFTLETYKYSDLKPIPKAPSAFIMKLNNLSQTIQTAFNTQPLLISSFLILFGMFMGIFIGIIAHIAMKEPVIDEVKKEN